MGSQHVTLGDLWEGPRPEARFDRSAIAHLPEGARRYLSHVIAEATPLARAVRLRMRGEIKLKGWVPFRAEQVIRWERGMIWKARARMSGLPVSGWDRLVDGEGAQRWKLLGLIPVVTASGEDITRSVAGRIEAESMWLPSVLVDCAWVQEDASHIHTTVRVAGDESELHLEVGGDGRLLACRLDRWGDLDGTFARRPFGALVEEERTFGGYTIPSRLRVGWYVGTERFEREGEFFRGVIEEAEYR